MTLLKAIQNEQIRTLTENGAFAHNTSGSALTDLFAEAGALRSRREIEIASMFAKGLQEDETAALKLAFYTRDVRGGLGERRTGRIFLQVLAALRPSLLRRNLQYIPEYGRWDDLLALLKTPLKNDVIRLLKKQLMQDCDQMRKDEEVSLLAKWLPSVNASSRETAETGKMLAEAFGMSERTYRKTLSALRSRIHLTESLMTERAYDEINYEHVPSLAMNRYRNAFFRNDEEHFTAYLEAVKAQKKTIHSATLFPYDITEKYLYRSLEPDPVLEAQWNALPEYVHGDQNILIMADVSGSMYGRPLATSIGLAIYFAERNQGIFHNRFMTFSGRPELVEVKGETLYEKIINARNADWDMNTNLEAAFLRILQAAVKSHCRQEDMPDSLIIISDMEIDRCAYGTDTLFSDAMKRKFARYGYTLPDVVFWNVESRHNLFHASAFSENIQLASGQSAAVFEALMNADHMTPYDFMMKTLNSERYERIH